MSSAILLSNETHAYFDLATELAHHQKQDTGYGVQGGLFFPFVLDDQKALFADVRASIDDVLKNKEKAQKQLNTGLGFRSVIANNKVFGLQFFMCACFTVKFLCALDYQQMQM